MNYFWIFLGGGLGSLARFVSASFVDRQTGGAFPWGTLAVNVSGSFVIGCFATLSSPEGRWPIPLTGRQFVMAGICGGYTTFSAFSLRTLELMREGQAMKAGANVVLSVTLCLLAVWLGHVVAASLSPRP